MKINKQFLKKLNNFRLQFPVLNNLFPEQDEFNKIVIDIIRPYAENYGSGKILNRFIKCYALSMMDYQDVSEFISDMSKRISAMIKAEFENEFNDDKNNILTYFNEIKKIYNDNNQFKDEVDFLPENRDWFIKSNLKLVIATAKRYIGMGVPFEDLIGAGNLGLCEAFDKFKSQQNNIRDCIMNEINDSKKENWSKEEFSKILEKYYTYGDAVDKIKKKIPVNGFKNINDLNEWVKKHVKTAVFASVAFMWIRAYILIEINKNAHVVHFPESAVKSGPVKSNLFSLSEYSDQQTSDIDIKIEDDINIEELTDVSLRDSQFKSAVRKIFSILTPRERRIVIKKFGIDMPGPMTIPEIAEDENISTSRCTAAYKDAMKKIRQYCNSIGNRDFSKQIQENLY